MKGLKKELEHILASVSAGAAHTPSHTQGPALSPVLTESFSLSSPPLLLFLRDVLPFTLKLPDAIASARTSADLEEVAKLGAGLVTHFLLGLCFGDEGDKQVGCVCVIKVSTLSLIQRI